MSQYHLEIIISKEEVEVIKEQLHDYIEEAGGFAIYVASDNMAEPSEELECVIKKIFFNIMMTIHNGKFEGVQ